MGRISRQGIRGWRDARWLALLRSQAWAGKSLLINACGSALDYCLMLTLVRGLHVPVGPGVAAGLTLGATFNFAVNRRVVFAGAPGSLARQALRYLLAMAVLIVIHASALHLLCEWAHAPLLAVKPVADCLVLGLSQPWVLRHFVFRPEPPSLVPEPARSI